MSAGDILNPKRVRTQANERLDTVDADAISQAPRSFLDAYGRAVEAKPRNAGGSTPVGLILQGFGLTLNPTGPNDNKIRVQSPAGVAFDSDGRMLIKENGITIDLTLPGGNSQVYAFFIDDNVSTSVRRFISVTSPYVESGSAIATALKGDVAYWVRAGDQTSIVSSDVVNGKTTALCFLGVATNTGGAITMAGYDTVIAPNGQYTTNRLTSVVAPTTPPPTNTANGSLGTMLDVLTAALYSLGQAMWKHSDHLTPSLANNFGAYNIPAGGVDKAFRQALGYVTIGDGVTAIGDFNASDFGNNNSLFVAAIAALPAAGGRLYIKPGVSLSGFAGATIALPAGKTVEIIGDHSSVPTNAPHLTFAASEGFACSATGALVLTNLHVSYAGTSPFLLQAGPFKIRNVYLSCTDTATTTTLAAIRDGAGATAITNVDIDGLTWSTAYTSIQVLPALFRVFSGTIPCSSIKILNVTHNNATHEAGMFSFPNVANDFEIGRVIVNQSFATVGIVSPAILISVASLDNAVNTQGRFIHDVTVNNTAGTIPKMIVLFPATCGFLRVARLDTDPTSCSSIVSGLNVSGPMTFEDCLFQVPGISFTILGSCGDIDFVRCKWLNGSVFSIGDGTDVIGKIRVDRNLFSGSYATVDQGSSVFGTFVESVLVTDSVFDGINDVNQASWAIVAVYGGTTGVIREARFLRNTVSDFQNVAYAGADATSTPIFFRVNAREIDMAECSDTVLRNIMNADGGSSGNARRAPYVFEVTTNTGNTGLFGNINFERNKSIWYGPTEGSVALEACQAFTITNFSTIINLVVDGNELSMPYNTTTAAQTNDIYYLNSAGSGAATIESFRWTNNKTRIGIGDAVPASMAIEVLHAFCNFSTGNIDILYITHNTLYVAYASASFNFTTRFGCGIYNFGTYATIVHDNVGNKNSSGITGFWGMEFNVPGVVFNVNGDAGALPGASNSFPNCVNFHQA